MDDVRLSEKDLNAAKTMNTHLHILEAYTNLYRIAPHHSIHEALKRLLLLFYDKFIDQDQHLHLFYDKNWSLMSQEVSFGHDIEASWLMCEAAAVLGDKNLITKFDHLAINICEGTLQKGIDQDGGLFNEGLDQQIIDSDKHWWPQAEAVIGFINAYQISGKKKYYLAANRVWQFIEAFVKDKTHGEWHWRINQKGEVIKSEDKAGPWKAPYHNLRMCMELLQRL